MLTMPHKCQPLPWQHGNDNYGKPRLAYCLKIWFMLDTELLKETAEEIYWSAWASNKPRSDWHWHVDACYDEWHRRGTPEKYEVAFKMAKQKAGL